MESTTHELILSVVNQGYSEGLMDAARTAGARGGTIINARHVGHEDTIKFFGISVQEEKEIVAIVSERGQKTAIMQAISHEYGLNTPARGIIISIPVDSVAGLA